MRENSEAGRRKIPILGSIAEYVFAFHATYSEGGSIRSAFRPAQSIQLSQSSVANGWPVRSRRACPMSSADLLDGMKRRTSTKNGASDWSFCSTTSSRISSRFGRTMENAGNISYIAALES